MQLPVQFKFCLKQLPVQGPFNNLTVRIADSCQQNLRQLQNYWTNWHAASPRDRK